MLIKNIFMEVRSRLRSCNVYITTALDFSKGCHLKITIQANCIILNFHSDDEKTRNYSTSSTESLSDCYTDDDNENAISIPIEQYCKIIPNSMSCLKIDKKNISFRILTEPNNGGNFYKELLSPNSECSIKGNALNINFTINNLLKILCSNCSNIICDNVKFDRILELPTANLDMSQWFCHGHSNVTESNTTLTPNKSDFLHRLTFFVINIGILSDTTNKFNTKRNVYHCNRCLAWLGLKNIGTVKLFNSEIKLVQDGIEKCAFTYKTPEENISTSDFVYTIENIMKEFNLGLQYNVMCKIVLEYTASDSNKQYILIWIMDKELQVLRNVTQINNDIIKLESSLLTKILYKVEMCLNDEVESWLSDPSVVSTDISRSMFSSGLEHLQKMSLKVPESFRMANGYHVTYLKV